jgi:hypothetical protein
MKKFRYFRMTVNLNYEMAMARCMYGGRTWYIIAKLNYRLKILRYSLYL